MAAVAIHEERAGSFGSDPARYDRARPHYSEDLTHFLLQDGPKRVLDVGCGTGIASRPFQVAGCTVHGVEHDPRMAEVARTHGLTVDVAKFEDWEAEGIDPFDLVISGQAWHWIDQTAGPTTAAGALRPGGRIAIFWVSYSHRVDVAEVFASVYGVLASSLLTSFSLGRDPVGNRDLALLYAPRLIEAGSFVQPEVRTFTSNRTYTVESWLDELPTHSDHRLLPSSQRGRLLESLGDELRREIGEEFTVNLSTHLVTSTRS